MRDIDACMAGQLLDVKARVRDGQVVHTLDVLVAGGRAPVDAIRTEMAAIAILDVKAHIRDGRAVETFDVFGPSAGDGVVRVDAAALQLIDVKAHVLGGFA